MQKRNTILTRDLNLFVQTLVHSFILPVVVIDNTSHIDYCMYLKFKTSLFWKSNVSRLPGSQKLFDVIQENLAFHCQAGNVVLGLRNIILSYM